MKHDVFLPKLLNNHVVVGTFTTQNDVLILYENGYIALVTIGSGCSLNCSHHGKCVKIRNKKTCVCELGWYGINCELQGDLCVTNACFVLGVERCLVSNNTLGYICQCKNGWVGETCSVMQRQSSNNIPR